MATYSKTFLAYPDNFVQPNGQTVFLQDRLSSSGATNPLGSYSLLSGWYNSLPKLCLSGAPGTVIAPLIQVTGYDEAYLMPVASSGTTAELQFYLVFGDNQSGGESTRWLVQHFYNTGTMATSATGMAMNSPLGTAYKSFTGLGTATTGMSKVLEDTIGCTTSARAGVAGTTEQVYGFPHLGGADYLAICSASNAADTNINCYVRLG